LPGPLIQKVEKFRYEVQQTVRNSNLALGCVGNMDELYLSFSALVSGIMIIHPMKYAAHCHCSHTTTTTTTVIIIVVIIIIIIIIIIQFYISSHCKTYSTLFRLHSSSCICLHLFSFSLFSL
jgi:hypothetical protein